MFEKSSMFELYNVKKSDRKNKIKQEKETATSCYTMNL